MTDNLYYKRLLIARDRQLDTLLVLEAQVPKPSQRKIAKAAEQLLTLNEAIKEFERQEKNSTKL